MKPNYMFKLNAAKLRDIEQIPARLLRDSFYEEYEPGRLRIDRAREHRNPEYFVGIFNTVLELVPIYRALGELDVARDRLALVPNALREAFEFNWRPDGLNAQRACVVAIVLGERHLADAAAKADEGFAIVQPDGTEIDTTDLSACSHTRCLAGLALEDDKAARVELDAMAKGYEDYSTLSDHRLLSAHSRLLGSILNSDPVELDDATRILTSNLLNYISKERHREHSEGLIDWPTTAALAIAKRRGIKIPTDLPTCAVELIVKEWVS